MDDKGIGKKNFRRWGTSIQEISAQQVMLGTIAPTKRTAAVILKRSQRAL
jgi:hypothetical protein